MRIVAAKTYLILGVVWLFFLLMGMHPTQIDLSHILESPSFQYFLGTDSMGRDLYSRLNDCLVTCLGMLTLVSLSSVIAILTSTLLLEYHLWRKLFLVLKMISYSIPAMVWVVGLSIVLDGFGTYPILTSVIIFSALQMSSKIYESFIRDLKTGFWQAAQTLGYSSRNIIYRHGLKTLWIDEVVSEFIFLMQRIVIVEISLGYLGIGLQEPFSSFGNILAEHLSFGMNGDWWAFAVTGWTLCCVFNVLQNSHRIFKWTVTQLFQVIDSVSFGRRCAVKYGRIMHKQL